MNIKAIDTHYAGYKFRSRLEARWAVFFDHLGSDWQYEPEGFELPGLVRYLPDFKVTSPQGFVAWYEVKASKDKDDGKMALFEKSLDSSPNDGFYLFNVLCGDPIEFLGSSPAVSVCPRCGGIFNIPGDGDSWECWQCDLDTPSGSDSPTETGFLAATKVYPHKGSVLFFDQGSKSLWSRHVLAAALEARQARFEHGATTSSRMDRK